MYINKVFLCGRVGAKPEFFKDDKIARFSMATQIHYIKDNEKRSRTTWHRIILYKPLLVELVKKYIDTGVEVYIEGLLDYSTYHDQKTNSDKTVSFIECKVMKVSKFKTKAEEPAIDDQTQAEMNNEDEVPSFTAGDDLPY